MFKGGMVARRERTVYEYIVIFAVVVISVSLAVALYAGRAKVRKGHLLMQELSMLRNGIQIYQLVNRQNPSSLAEMESSTYGSGSESRRYVEPLPKNSEGRLIDPFGNPYLYDPKSAWVHSQTKGFERW